MRFISHPNWAHGVVSGFTAMQFVDGHLLGLGLGGDEDSKIAYSNPVRNWGTAIFRHGRKMVECRDGQQVKPILYFRRSPQGNIWGVGDAFHPDGCWAWTSKFPSSFQLR